VARRVGRTSDGWIRPEWGSGPSVSQQRDAVLEAFERAIPHIIPTPQELIAQNLSRVGIVTFSLRRAGHVEPCFRPDIGDPLAIRLFENIFTTALDEIFNNAELQNHVFQVLLERLSELQRVQAQEQGVLKVIRDQVSTTETRVLQAIASVSPGLTAPTNPAEQDIFGWINKVRARLPDGIPMARAHILTALLDDKSIAAHLRRAHVDVAELRLYVGRLTNAVVGDHHAPPPSSRLTGSVRRICSCAIAERDRSGGSGVEWALWTALSEDSLSLLDRPVTFLSGSDSTWVQLVRSFPNFETAVRDGTPYE
jgi:hypothetical protein